MNRILWLIAIASGLLTMGSASYPTPESQLRLQIFIRTESGWTPIGNDSLHEGDEFRVVATGPSNGSLNLYGTQERSQAQLLASSEDGLCCYEGLFTVTQKRGLFLIDYSEPSTNRRRSEQLKNVSRCFSFEVNRQIRTTPFGSHIELLIRRALDKQRGGQFADALIYTTAILSCPKLSRTDEERAHLTHGICELKMLRYTSAARSLEIAAKSEFTSVAVPSLLLLSEAYGMTGQRERQLTVINNAMALARSFPRVEDQENWESAAVCELASYFRVMNQDDKSLSVLDEYSRRTLHTNPPGLLRALSNLGMLQERAGMTSRANESYLRGLKLIHNRVAPSDRLMLLARYGGFLNDFGNNEGIGLLELAYKSISDSSLSIDSIATIESEYAIAVARVSPKRAITIWKQLELRLNSSREFASFPEWRQKLFRLTIDGYRGHLASRCFDYADAVDPLERTLLFHESSRLRSSWLRLPLALSCMKTGKLERARLLLSEAEEEFRELGADEPLASCLHLAAIAELQRGDRASGLARAREALALNPANGQLRLRIACLVRHLDPMAPLPLDRLSQQLGRAGTAADEGLLLDRTTRVDAVIDQFLTSAADNTSGEEYALLAARRAVALRSRLAALRHADPALLQRLRAVRIELSRAAAPALVQRGGTAEQQQMLRLTAEKLQLESRVNQRREPSAVRLAHDWAAEVPDDAVLIDIVNYNRTDRYFELSGASRTPHYTAFVLHRRQGVRRVPLGPGLPIEAAIAEWRSALKQRVSMAKSLDQLGRLLWQPLRSEIPGDVRRVYLCVQGRLAPLPWAALPVGGGQQVLDRYVVSRIPGPQFLRRRPRPPAERHDRQSRLLLVGAVDYEHAAEQRPADARGAAASDAQTWTPDDAARWRPLQAAAREIQQVAAHAAHGAANSTAVILDGERATLERVVEELPSARWVHFATHGFQGTELPLLPATQQLSPAPSHPLLGSGLVLAGANRLADEGPLAKDRSTGLLTAETVSGLNLSRLELAVLSACQTGLGDPVDRDVALGLQNAFHMAGVEHVLGTLWSVNDHATQALVDRFYHHLWRAGLPPAAALRAAQLELRDGQRTNGSAERGPDFRRPPQRVRAGDNTWQWAGLMISSIEP